MEPEAAAKVEETGLEHRRRTSWEGGQEERPKVPKEGRLQSPEISKDEQPV